MDYVLHFSCFFLLKIHIVRNANQKKNRATTYLPLNGRQRRPKEGAV